MNNKAIELITALGTLVLALLVLNPFDFFMPTMLAMSFLAALFILFALFAAFVLRERPADEREEQHRARSGRAAFLTGAFVLVAAIIAQHLYGAPDPWLTLALCAMILAKLIAGAWSDARG